jgi:hypothetical protein
MSWRRQILVLAWFVVLFCTVGGCAGKSETKAGSETNWLTVCDSDADCGAAHCLCGVCTAPCAGNADCSAHDGAKCALAGSTGHTAQCGVIAGAPAGICMPSCDANNACAAGELCAGGVCTRTPTGAATLANSGASCLLHDELTAGFSGFDAKETNLEGQNPQCGSGDCLGYHFQGRASCPYGQASSELSLPDLDPNRCRVPNVDGSSSADAVTVAVVPQLIARRALDTVYCSCQCAGPLFRDTSLCACPAGMECDPVLEMMSGSVSYCVKAGTLYDSSNLPSALCDKASIDPASDCGNARQNP